MMQTLVVRLRFHSPYEVRPWEDEQFRTKAQTGETNDLDPKRVECYLRYGRAAEWHRRREGLKVWSPYVRGDLVRSEVLEELREHFLVFDRFLPPDNRVCPGRRDRHRQAGGRASGFQSHVSPLESFGNANSHKICEDQTSSCPHCQLLGAFDLGGAVRFQNLPSCCWFTNQDDLAPPRRRNQISPQNRKALSSFTVWEADPGRCGVFFGGIAIDTARIRDLAKVEALLAGGLARVTSLAGAACRLDLIGRQEGLLDDRGWQELVPRLRERWEGESVEPLLHRELLAAFARDYMHLTQTGEASATPVGGEVTQVAEQLPAMAEPANAPAPEQEFAQAILLTCGSNRRHLHRLAAAIRLIGQGRQSPDELLTTKPGTERSTLWGKGDGLAQGTIKEILVTAAASVGAGRDRQQLFGRIADLLAREADASGKSGLARNPGQLIGRKEQFHTPAPQGPPEYEQADLPGLETAEYFYTGWLVAASPLAVGGGDGAGGDEVHQPVLRDAAGRFRIPFSALRGVIDSELRRLLGPGCGKEHSRKSLCPCRVCALMRRVAIDDALADTPDNLVPADLRMRNHLSPSLGTVEHLFSTEAVPEGLRFPFRLRLRPGHQKDRADLGLVLGLWQQGFAFVGGRWGSGKGRMELADLHEHALNLPAVHPPVTMKQAYLALLDGRFFRAQALPRQRELLNSAGLTEAIPTFPAGEPPCHRLECVLEFHSPVLSGDPVAALFHPESPDNVVFRKTKVTYDTSGRPHPTHPVCLKGEGNRGVLSYLLGKTAGCHDLAHDDCQCPKCRLFGSQQKGGPLRFDDFEPVQPDETGNNWVASEPGEMRSDRVALDLFGGAKPQAKFDDRPLAGSPERPLYFKGAIWYSPGGLDGEPGQLLRRTFIDLQNVMA
ncbi:MAG: hypothetical protein HGA96_16590, partial [Desulfobulbaceae bacterium]|nr:hypothetical protein [Desulfobulbaceae bacterium]